jgi:S1-C subfamily serine protease
MNRRFSALAGSALGIAALTCAAGLSAPHSPTRTAEAAAHDDGALYKSLVEKVGPSIVTLKMVLKFQGMGDEGRDHEVSGLMIDPKGIILISNVMIGGSARGMTITPSDVRVLFANEDESSEGLKARMIARDSELDLAWFQIDDEKAKDRTFAAVDLSPSAGGALGDRLYTVQRMDKFFDRTTFVSEGAVGGTTAKPRKLIIPSGFQVEPGGAVFGADGKVVGVGAIILPSEDDMDMGSPGQMYSRTGPLILPVADVRSATERAKEMAAKPEGAAPANP